MPRLVSSDCICLEPLPKWPGAEGLRPRFVTYAETYKAVHAVAPIANRAGIYKVTIGG